MFRNTFTSLAWVCVFALASIGALSCINAATDPDPVVRQEFVTLQEQMASANSELAAATSSGDPEAIASAEAKVAQANSDLDAFETALFKKKFGPFASVLGAIHPALIPIAAIGLNSAAALTRPRGRRLAWESLKHLTPFNGTDVSIGKGLKAFAALNGWEDSRPDPNAKAPTPPAA